MLVKGLTLDLKWMKTNLADFVYGIKLFYSVHLSGRGEGHLSFQDTGLCHSNRKNTTLKLGKLSQNHTYLSKMVWRCLVQALKLKQS